MIWTWVLVTAALAVAASVAVLAFRRPILFRMAARNALRRPKQTATVIAGLMIGTAIVSAALVAGQSATSAIREVVYESLGEIDETVRISGYPFFPRSVLDDITADPEAAAFFDAAAPTILWQAAATHGDLYEPGITLIGYDPGPDAAFGDFIIDGRPHDGRGLASNEAFVSAELAEALELRAGDRIDVALTLPVDPLLPTLDVFGGVVGVAIDVNDQLPIPIPVVDPEPATHDLLVPKGTTQLTFVLVCGDIQAQQPCTQGTQLRMHADAPDGRRYSFTGPAQGQGPAIGWFNVTAPDGSILPGGDWLLTVTGTLAAQSPYTLTAVSLKPVFDLDELQQRAEELQREFGIELDDLGEFGRRVETSYVIRGISDGGRGGQFSFIFHDRLFVRLDGLQTLLERPGEVNLLKFSNPGGVASGASRTDEAVRILNATLRELRAASPDHAVIQALEVNPAKQDSLQQADDAGQLMTGLMIFAGSLSIITGLLLIINIFTMLAEERRSELGMARAVGLTRRDLVRLFVFEGSLYAIAAAFVGAILGLGLAYIMIAGLNSIIAEQGGFPPIPFKPDPSSVPIAFAAGALLTFATIFLASRRQSRLNIVRAIRQIEDPDRSASWWQPSVGFPLATAGLFVTVVGWVLPQFSMQVFGPLGVAVGLMLALRRWFRRKHVDTSIAAVLGAYYATTIYTITEFEDIEEANLVGPVRAVMLTLCVVIIMSYWQTGPKLLGRVLSRFKRMRAVAMPAVSYPQHKRFRTGMTLAMFSIVILSIGFFSIFGGLFEVDPARHTGGYDVEGRTTLQVPDLSEYDRGLLSPSAIEALDEVRMFTSFDHDFITVGGGLTGHFGPPLHHVYGIDAGWVQHQDFRLLWTLDGMTEEETYQRLLSDPDAIIVSYEYSTDENNRDLSHEVGETLVMHIGDCVPPGGRGTGQACPNWTIIGIQEQYHFSGVWLPEARMKQLFPQTEGLYLVKLASGIDPEEFAKDFERNYRDVGMDADASQVLVEEEQKAFRQILGAMKVFLGLGLIVGVLSLGIITSRSVLERRQEIGMMRALGFTGNQVRRIFFIEVTLIIVLGALIGIVCSIIVTYGLWFAIIRELQYPYSIPWGEIGLLLGISYAVALLATLAPILRAARIPPAEALRYIE